MENPENKDRMKHRNYAAIVAGVISFFILFFGVSFLNQDDEMSVNDLPAISTDVYAEDAVTTAIPEVTETTSEATTVASTVATSTEATTSETSSAESSESETDYILNTSTRKFHYPDCRHVSSIKDENKKEYTGSRDDLITDGYSPCGTCNP